MDILVTAVLCTVSFVIGVGLSAAFIVYEGPLRDHMKQVTAASNLLLSAHSKVKFGLRPVIGDHISIPLDKFNQLEASASDIMAAYYILNNVSPPPNMREQLRRREQVDRSMLEQMNSENVGC